ncbi:ADP-ribosylglycohydrolase family protein [Pseudomonas fulva]|uniref:ADP-ribosylglycohydrolase family protein n=1 Tax=Pseudomonas TaxID=286 RepID=UPI0019CF5E90|nr:MULTISPECIES: ADP-ribosylglycohydrolase family protein [Pseudomonas]MCY4126061.1 ADP-ribosylglycohydrolase family protein [Pseudomonas sp.]MBN6790562.1 ADP-ribosylglycohydrolase family protein [Pseudomonas fulva]MBN6795800.1 ADP-ribosylglycohydrolase family protein [Pseudomonas fulva]MBN6856193.1 ADP-ribosylglycohydrolase family protein [Pseudomonas fulva]MBN6871067.1 ADP-ribosylglycohydrolase family protein [Pseudomonas fulva]
MNRIERISGCLLGGAVGDALGSPVELLEWPVIEARFGSQGASDFAPAFGITGAISGATQMMLFTAEGLLRAYVLGSSRQACHVPSIIHHALLRWLTTQDYPSVIPVATDSWLIRQMELWSRRAPDITCMSALKVSGRLGMVAENNSKGCGALVRVAPCAFFAHAFDYASQSGRLTHGHPTGYLAAGLFADILQCVVGRQDSLEHAVTQSLARYGQVPGIEETRSLVERVMFFFYEGYTPSPQRIDDFAGGWGAEQVLAIGLWCALAARSFEDGVIAAVNHSGDSSTTGLVVGHLLGAQYGVAAIPDRWLERLELRQVIAQVAEDIECVPREYYGVGGEFDEQIELAYPAS